MCTRNCDLAITKTSFFCNWVINFTLFLQLLYRSRSIKEKI